MASVEECRAAIDELARRLDRYDPQVRAKNIPERTVGITLLDLDATFVGRLRDGALVDVEQVDNGPRPQVRLVMNSDDLIALTNRDLHFAHAWASGRVRLDASLRDLLRLRALM